MSRACLAGAHPALLSRAVLSQIKRGWLAGLYGARMSEHTLSFHRVVAMGLRHPARHETLAVQREARWRWPILLALLLTIPAFYLELIETQYSHWADIFYALGGSVQAFALMHVSLATRHPLRHLRGNALDVVLVSGLLLCSWLPHSLVSDWSLGVRLAVALLTLTRMVWAVQNLFSRAGVAYLMALALLVLVMCGLGFYWLEPSVKTLGDGLWLAFTTAATVGYGDMVPRTPAAKIFSVFVVILGYGVLSLITAAIAANFVEGEEREIEREVLREMRREVRTDVRALQEEINRLSDEIRALRGALLSPGEGQDGPDVAEPGQAASVTPVAGKPAFAPTGEVRPAATVAPADSPVLPSRDKG